LKIRKIFEDICNKNIDICLFIYYVCIDIENRLSSSNELIVYNFNTFDHFRESLYTVYIV